MGKSKHPPLLKKALADIARVNTEMKKEVAALKGIAKACASTQKFSASTAGDFVKQYKYLQDVIEKYAKKVIAIEQLEKDMAAAKGDKKKEAEVKKKLAKAEKEADAHRKEYSLAGDVFGTLTGLMNGEIDKLAAASGKFSGFTK